MADDIVGSTTQAAAEIFKAIPVYEDALQPVAKEIGKSLKTVGGVINIALSPLSAMVYGFDIIKGTLKKRLETRLSGVSPSNIITPSLQIVGPLLDKYKYVHDKADLADMFVNLLAVSMDKDTLCKAHPSFVNVISELSPDEAKIVKYLFRNPIIPKIDITIKSKIPNDQGYNYIIQNFTDIGKNVNLDFPDMVISYLSNLERLNIIKCSTGQFQEYLIKNDTYTKLEEDTKIIEIKENYQTDNVIDIIKGHIKTTDYGKMFMAAVLNTSN